MKPQLFAPMLAAAQDAAREAGHVLRDNFEGEFQVSQKGYINFVTDIDLKSEEVILRRIGAAFPGHMILSEEKGASDGASPFRWVIDPLDGTTNYAHGYPAFCVSIALECEGALVVGVIYDPLPDEMFWAVAGEGAYRNGKPMHVSKRARLEDALLGTGFSYNGDSLRRNLHFFNEFMTRASGVRRVGAAARDLSYVACGRYDAVWEVDLKPWDLAAGILLIREAGGTVSDFQGGTAGPDSREILLSNGLLHEEMLAVLTEA
jgi:myo-inositol-1(or 4)-monophosphatase